jgi:exosortase A-associated hydrolase 1
MTEIPVCLDCEGASLVGVLFTPEKPARRGVVIVVGGPQYRIGSHRQFLTLARDVAAAGFPVLSFDHRGIGDSDGPFLGFEHLDADIRTAVDGLIAHAPEVEDVVLWGLCDGASAISFYAAQDPRIKGAVIVNPWIRSDQSFARAYIRQHYRERLRDPAFWRGLLTGQVNPFRLAMSALGTIVAALGLRRSSDASSSDDGDAPLPDRMADGLARFEGPILLITSGRDLMMSEFAEIVGGSSVWQRVLGRERVTRRDIAPADHTYSRREWRSQVHAWTIDWLRSAQ